MMKSVYVLIISKVRNQASVAMRELANQLITAPLEMERA